MAYYQYQLQFETPVRFGLDGFHANLSQSRYTCRCDTFFSALYMTGIQLFGEQKMQDFLQKAQEGAWQISDLMPYYKETLFVPKPKLFFQRQEETGESVYSKKEMKGLRYIPLNQLEAFVQFLKTGENPPMLLDNNFGQEQVTTRVMVTRTDHPEPYVVSSFRFRPEAGLYFFLKAEEKEKEKEMIEQVLGILATTGIGGKRSSGYGKFVYTVSKVPEALQQYFTRKAPFYMTLSTLFPSKEDMENLQPENAFYTIVKRSGYVFSATYAPTQRKKQTIFMFDTGSCFVYPLTGAIAEVSNNKQGKHPVYKYGKAFLLGV